MTKMNHSTPTHTHYMCTLLIILQVISCSFKCWLKASLLSVSFTFWKNILTYYLINMSLNFSPIFVWMNVSTICHSCAAGVQEVLLRCCQKQYAPNMQAYTHAHSNTETLAIEMQASIHICQKADILKLEWRSAVDAGKRSVMWNSFFAADKFVGPATSTVYAAYQKLAARTSAHGPTALFISILKLYVTDTACIAKWRLLKHNDDEAIIIWRSTRGGSHPKCSLRRRIWGPRMSNRTNLQKKLFPPLSLPTCLSADLHCLPLWQ